MNPVGIACPPTETVGNGFVHQIGFGIRVTIWNSSASILFLPQMRADTSPTLASFVYFRWKCSTRNAQTRWAPLTMPHRHRQEHSSEGETRASFRRKAPQGNNPNRIALQRHCFRKEKPLNNCFVLGATLRNAAQHDRRIQRDEITFIYFQLNLIKTVHRFNQNEHSCNFIRLVCSAGASLVRVLSQ